MKTTPTIKPILQICPWIMPLMLIAPLAAPAQSTTSTVIAAAQRPDYTALVAKYNNGYQQWLAQLKKANANKDRLSAETAYKNQQIYMDAKLVAEVAEMKSKAVKDSVLLLPTPGPAPEFVDVAGDLDPAIHVHPPETGTQLQRLYQDYLYAIKYWYKYALECRAKNDTVKFDEAIANAKAFEDAYHTIKQTAGKAELARIKTMVTPVPGLPKYPFAPPVIVATPAITPVPTPTPTPSPAEIAAKAAAKAKAVATPSPTPELLVIPSDKKVVQLNDRSFSSKTRRGTWVVEFGATWCPPCQKMKPIMRELAFENNEDITYAVIDVDQSPRTKKSFNVTAFPTFFLLKDGKISATKRGGMSKEGLKQFASQ